MHEIPYEITTLTGQPQPIPRPVMLPDEMPPGVDWVTLPGGRRTLAYTHQPTTLPPPPAAARPVPTWAKTTALLAPTIGGGIAAAGIGLSYAAPGLIAMSHALWATVALIAAGAIALPVLLGACRRGGRGGPARITQNITATGLFGKATGTINHR
ncbi:hypothetical protein [Streptomyces lavendofoliae]|uniref:Uncharacterized protein n=1 Tax=Streptomyces lavendofoliae TaxID=67314 RepID=A0A918I4N8_9ACTN|nr:hypothetical protein [Streptomyces lavendofoliae]GGU69115.1 hypothetical protein GCM10010274_66560 [Streptomyces lavendofoliae]